MPSGTFLVTRALRALFIPLAGTWTWTSDRLVAGHFEEEDGTVLLSLSYGQSLRALHHGQ